MYKHEVRSDLVGFTNFTLAWAPPNTTSQPCRLVNFLIFTTNYFVVK
ncbi:unnamed protein product [Schistosoma margrebowiei]|nr:unnamed protein product [Schistosoma margrebowiei]